jgi:pyridoxal phosphate enzyme (YggS family)
MKPTEIAARYARVCERIEAAARRARRNPDDVTLVVVTKTLGLAAVRAALAAGARNIGENYVQEAARKIEQLRSEAVEDGTAQPHWHLIGHLQRNKAARAAELFDLIHTVDSARLGQHLDRAGAERSTPVRVLVEVSIGGEATKSGVDPRAAFALVPALARLEHLRLEGLMAIPPRPPDPEASRPHFHELAALRAELAARGFDLPHLSMGMTDDYEVAIEEGATIVRVGRAIFGERA